MPCTTILVGKKASYDGSTMIARNDDGFFNVKKLVTVKPSEQKKKYKSVIGHLEIELPDNPLSYTCTPSVDPGDGIWAAQGINSANVGMTATETITTNPRVLGADPYVRYEKSSKKGEKDKIGGIGEEDLVVIVLPYIRSAREGVLRLGKLLETYGTYEPNGIAFNDENEIWWLETIGGHHWIARRVEDNEYVIMPNQFGLDRFDFDDAFGEGKNNLCSPDLKDFMAKYHLDLNLGENFNPRLAFGSHDDSDHVYNTPRAWYIGRYFNPTTYKWDGEDADFKPESDDIPWSLVPEHKITVEEVKYILSSHFQGTEYDTYRKAPNPMKGAYRPIGINRTGVMSICQIRGYMPEKLKGVQWVCFGANVFNTVIPLYTNVEKMPAYVSKVGTEVDTSNFYWCSRLVEALAEGNYGANIMHIERYQKSVPSKAYAIMLKYEAEMMDNGSFDEIEKANAEICDMAKKETSDVLWKVLREASIAMKCGYSRADN